MKKITSFNLARLRTEEDFGFHKLIQSEMANLPEAGEATPLYNAMTDFANAYTPRSTMP